MSASCFSFVQLTVTERSLILRLVYYNLARYCFAVAGSRPKLAPFIACTSYCILSVPRRIITALQTPNFCVGFGVVYLRTEAPEARGTSAINTAVHWLTTFIL